MFIYIEPGGLWHLEGGNSSTLNILPFWQTGHVVTSMPQILSNCSCQVSFSDGDKVKIMTLDAGEFIRRFLLHVLPGGFVKIRYYGLLANRNRKNNIAICRELLGTSKIETKDKDIPETWQEHLLRVSGVDVTKCPVCKKGRMCTVEVLYPSRCNGPPTL